MKYSDTCKTLCDSSSLSTSSPWLILADRVGNYMTTSVKRVDCLKMFDSEKRDSDVLSLLVGWFVLISAPIA